MNGMPPLVVPDAIWTRCRNVAPKYGVAADVLAALAWKESSFNPFAWNPEPRYPYLINVATMKPFRPLTPAETASSTPPGDFRALLGDPDQEWWGQRASWGVCQVMGAVARELGFTRPYLTELVLPDINIDFAAQHLSHKLKRYGGIGDALSAYNAGRPIDDNRANYVAPILRTAEIIRAQQQVTT